MYVSGINIVFTYSEARKNFWKMDRKFLNLFTDFCKSENITEVAVNSSYRSDAKGSYHYFGWALDIYYLKYKSGKIQFYTVREKSYSVSDDDKIFNSFNRFFGKYRREYISPANILTGYKQGQNIFRNKSFKQKNKELDKLIAGATYEINRNHLHHLHLAVNPDPNAKGMKMIAETGKLFFPILVGLAAFIYKNKKAKSFLQKKLKKVIK
jgi:hypothetical protein